MIGLGSCRKLGLAEAREEWRKMLLQVAQGKDPKVERQQKSGPVPFEQLVELFLAETTEACVGWRSALKRYAYPTIGNILISHLATEHVRLVVAPIWMRHNRTAVRLGRKIATMWNFARSKGMVEPSAQNPAAWKGALEHAGLAKPSKARTRKRMLALKYTSAPAFMVKLADRQALAEAVYLAKPTKQNRYRLLECLALEFLILTAVRPGTINALEAEKEKRGGKVVEVRPAVPPLRWSDIPQGKAEWRIPKLKTDRAIREGADPGFLLPCARARSRCWSASGRSGSRANACSRWAGTPWSNSFGSGSKRSGASTFTGMASAPRSGRGPKKRNSRRR